LQPLAVNRKAVQKATTASWPTVPTVRGHAGYKAVTLYKCRLGIDSRQVAHLVRDEGVAGSNPATLTSEINDLANYGCSVNSQPSMKSPMIGEKIPPNKKGARGRQFD
jgi:hypothetical protein